MDKHGMISTFYKPLGKVICVVGVTASVTPLTPRKP